MPTDWPTHVRRALESMGEDITYTPVAGVAKTVRGLFLAPFQTIDLGQGAFQTARTEFVAMTADFPTPKRNDTIQRGAVVYKIREVESDAVGGYSRIPVGA